MQAVSLLHFSTEGGRQMPHIYKKRPDTRLQIIQLGARLFVDEGYSSTSCSKIAKALDLSTGNITFYFKTKEDLLAVLVKESFAYQDLMMQQAANEGKTSLLTYCLEISSMASICEEDLAARDFYSAGYSSEKTLKIIRENDTEKTKNIFSQFCPDWTDEQWAATENIVSGIEYATIMTREADTPLPLQIERTLSAIMLLYNVPEELRKIKINKVLATDYRSLGRKIFKGFRDYIEMVNEQNLEAAMEEKEQ